MLFIFYIVNSIFILCFLALVLFELLKIKPSNIILLKIFIYIFMLLVLIDLIFNFYWRDFFNLSFDFLLFIFIFWLLKILTSPFYKAVAFLQKKDYLHFYLLLLDFKTWYKELDFRGFGLIHYALLYKSEANLFKALFEEKLKFNAYDEDSFVDLLRKMQKEGKNTLHFDSQKLQQALNIKGGKRARFKAFTGVKSLKLKLEGINLLSFSALCGDLFMLNFLKQRGFENQALKIKGFEKALFAQHFALLNNNFTILEWLNDYYQNINLDEFKDDTRINTLALAVLNDDIQRVKLYHHLNIKGEHPIFLASSFGKLQSLEFLLHTKPYLKELKDKEGLTLLDRAMKFQNLSSFKMLVEKAGFSFEAKLFSAVSEGGDAILDYMLEKGYEIKATELCLCYYLWFDSDDDTIFKRLVRIGTDFVDKEGESPLITAVKAKLTSKAIKLIKAGANIDLKDAYGKTALDYAKEDKNEKLIALLDRSFEED